MKPQSIYAAVSAFTLTAFAFSGMLKWLPLLPDTTILFGVLSVSIMVVSALQVRVAYTPSLWLVIFCILLFFAWYVFTISYTYSTSFWQRKLLVTILNALAFVFPLIVFQKTQHFHYFEKALVFGCCVVMAFTIYFYAMNDLNYLHYQGYDRDTSKIPDYLAMGTLTGIGALILFYRGKLINWLLLGVAIFTLIVLAGRAPILFTVLLIILMAWRFRQLKRRSRIRFLSRFKLKLYQKSLLVLLLFLGAKFLIDIGALDVIVQRFLGLLDSKDGLRITAFTEAWKVINTDVVFGVGMGAYSAVAYGIDGDGYPHNLFIEAFAEAGFIGLLLFALGLVMAASLLQIAWKSKRGILYSCLFGFVFLNFMKSGGFISARVFYMFLGVYISYINYFLKFSKQSKNRNHKNSTDKIIHQ